MATVERNESLAHFIARRARAASDGALAGWAAGGAGVLLVAIVVRPPAWVFTASLAALALAFGGWGIAQRELDDPEAASHPRTAAAFRVVRALAVLLAVLATLALVFAVPMLGIGRISH